MKSKILINKLNIEVEAPSSMEGKKLQIDISDLVKTKLIKKIDAIFTKKYSDKSFRIQNLEIDLDDLNITNWELELEERLSKKLAQHLEELNISKNYSISKPNSKIEIYLYFLEKGILPWWSKDENSIDLKNAFKENLKVGNFISQLFKIINTNKQALKRLIFQFTDKELNLIFKFLFKESIPINSHLKKIKTVFSEWWTEREIRLVFWKKTYETAFLKSKNKNLAQPGKVNSTKILEAQILEATIFYFFQKKKISKNSIISFQIIFSKLEAVFSKKEFKKGGLLNTVFLEKSKKKQLTTEFASKKIDPKNQKSPSFEITKSESFGEELSSEYYIQNSGLIILHPFFQILFEELNLTKNLVFKDEFLQGQAVLLMQYLVKGTSDFFEPELVLNKILCNFSLEKALESKLILSESQLIEAEKLLHATVKHWTALKNSSPEALRNSFIKRKGKISKLKDGDWKLFIPAEGQDILLSKLPWGIHMVKLPWMKSKLFVDWQ